MGSIEFLENTSISTSFLQRQMSIPPNKTPTDLKKLDCIPIVVRSLVRSYLEY